MPALLEHTTMFETTQIARQMPAAPRFFPTPAPPSVQEGRRPGSSKPASALERDFVRRRTLELRRAIQEGRIEIALQPQVELSTGRTVGAEALVRLRDEDGNLLPPSEFLPLAEATGLILPLGQRVVELACDAAVSLRGPDGQPLRIAFNLSALQFEDRHHLDALHALLQYATLLGGRLEVEITESAAIRDFDQAREQLLRFKALGVTVALDDFATGFSTFSALLRLPVDRLKIDRSFIREILSGDGMLTDLVLSMCRRLQLPTIAEGVESALQAEWLRRRGCNIAQGFSFARPMSMAQFERWLHERPC
jgi:EAL domain-containing protein (putative c-di-GMP-specific phosphodiesterase class I)